MVKKGVRRGAQEGRREVGGGVGRVPHPLVSHSLHEDIELTLTLTLP